MLLSAMTASAAHAEQPLIVDIVVAAKSTGEQSYALTGEIRPKETVLAAFPVGGRVTEVLVEAGQKVEADAPLARLDSIQQELALRTAEAGLTTARADHVQAVEDLERAEALLKSGATTRAVRDAAEDALRSAEGALEQAEADRDRARKALADTVLRAPSASTVTGRLVEPGQIIGAAQTAVELALDKGYEAVFEVPEAMLIEAPGDLPISLSRLDRPQSTFEGKVTELSPLINAETGTVEVTVHVLNPPEGLNFGEPVRGSVSLPAADRISLPYSAISASAKGPAVWRVDPETMKVTLQEVEIERYTTEQILLDGGIAEGDLVVTTGVQLLYPGRVVQRVEAGQ
ncbi:hypothetical protein AWJ14_10505 [Hoeflea olei]|uniref:CusB-like beta-barrel domain-containing protein n=2 Tax=Hoeflea olei TaxID=1480615 RepID=A0A1C1Z189_9HYPH|nr:hypothetical protein AWJ14_10505 [Hoeflea olei]